MAMKQFTRPDGSPIMINTSDIESYSAVRSDPNAPDAGPSTTGTRLVFGGGRHQDVLETPEQVAKIIGNLSR